MKLDDNGFARPLIFGSCVFVGLEQPRLTVGNGRVEEGFHMQTILAARLLVLWLRGCSVQATFAPWLAFVKPRCRLNLVTQMCHDIAIQNAAPIFPYAFCPMFHCFQVIASQLSPFSMVSAMIACCTSPGSVTLQLANWSILFHLSTGVNQYGSI
ncbi:hypothetical protein CI102_9683 [Trichoderma harzianum]|nr:hypothetical protein CI102_9683 [Trichoderma harzianum]